MLIRTSIVALTKCLLRPVVILIILTTSVLAKSHTTWFSRFDNNMLPEGLTHCKNNLYVGIATTQEIYRVSKKGKLTLFATLPTLGKHNGVMTGIVCDTKGALYAALYSKSPDIPTGIYRVSKTGGKAILFATAPYLVFPNGLVFDKEQNLYVSDSRANAILKITPQGKVSRWAQGNIFSGAENACPQKGTNKLIGANGITLDKTQNNIYVVNTDRATLIRIPILKNGTAGMPHIILGPICHSLAGADGLTTYKNLFLVAINRQNKIVAINQKTLLIKKLYEGSPLSFPASLLVLHTKNEDKLFVSNFSLMTQMAYPGRQTPGITVTRGIIFDTPTEGIY